jgi:hypothetical protein
MLIRFDGFYQEPFIVDLKRFLYFYLFAYFHFYAFIVLVDFNTFALVMAILEPLFPCSFLIS